MEYKKEQNNRTMIEIVVNDRMGKRIKIKCFPTDTILIVKKLVAAFTGTRPEKLILMSANRVYKDKITIEDYEISDGSEIELYYN